MDAEHRRHQHADDVYRLERIAKLVLGENAEVREGDFKPNELIVSLGERHQIITPRMLQGPNDYLTALLERSFR